MESQTKPKVFVAMSGGVDSSVAAALLKKEGYEVIGAHMRCYNVDGCAEQDAEDARRAAEILDIPFYTFDFEQEYKDKVVNYMVDGYRKGITPNPDVMCNKEIKFGLFLKKALEMGSDYVATGHYIKLASQKISVLSTCFATSSDFARLSSACDRRLLRKKTADHARTLPEVSKNNYFLLQQANDKNKDQSYFLWTLTQEQLKYCLFPIGEYKKPQVRKLAKKFGLLNANKKDSQGICFLGQVTLTDFLKKYIKPKAGKILNAAGEIIGKHRGAYFYTIGQRSGLNIGGTAKPLYVADKDVNKNILTVAEGDNHPALYKKEIQLTDLNLISPLDSAHSIPVLARVRYRQPLEKAKLTGNRLIFAKPVKFIAIGQSAVFYDKKGVMLGGGIIKSVL